jgi:hypothetical protein
MSRNPTEADRERLHEIKRNLSAKSAAFVDEIANEDPDLVVHPRRSLKLLAGHFKAEGEGLTPDSPQYFQSMRDHVGLSGGKRHVRVLAEGKQADPSNQNLMTRGEYRAATETVLWGREGGDKCGTAIGVEEYLRRRDAMRQQAGWFDKLD